VRTRPSNLPSIGETLFKTGPLPIHSPQNTPGFVGCKPSFLNKVAGEYFIFQFSTPIGRSFQTEYIAGNEPIVNRYRAQSATCHSSCHGPSILHANFSAPTKMKLFIRNLPAPAEFWLIVLVCFWWGIVGSARQFANHLFLHTAQPEHITNSLVLWAVVMQWLVMFFAFWIGHIRGWSLATLGARISWKGTGGGVLLFLVTTLVIIICIVLSNILAPGARNPAQPGVTASGLSIPFLVLFSIVNPVYEEVLGTGYFIHALQKYGKWPAILASALFRTFLHSYKGIDAILMVLPMGLVFGLAYWKWRQLWPLVVAHVIIDLWTLFSLIHPD
jgi:membrane protease YdiL (CAAX protease family)